MDNSTIDFDTPGPIGIQDIEAEQGFTKINTNRTLILTSANMEGPYEPEVIPEEHTCSLAKLMEYARPQVNVPLETGDEDNPSQEVNIRFDSLKSFKVADLEKRIVILQKQHDEEKRYLKIRAELERSVQLRKIIADPEKKAAFLDILESIREELETNNNI
jgi:hypothetical protein